VAQVKLGTLAAGLPGGAASVFGFAIVLGSMQAESPASL